MRAYGRRKRQLAVLTAITCLGSALPHQACARILLLHPSLLASSHSLQWGASRPSVPLAPPAPGAHTVTAASRPPALQELQGVDEAEVWDGGLQTAEQQLRACAARRALPCRRTAVPPTDSARSCASATGVQCCDWYPAAPPAQSHPQARLCEGDTGSGVQLQREYDMWSGRVAGHPQHVVREAARCAMATTKPWPSRALPVKPAAQGSPAHRAVKALHAVDVRAACNPAI